MIIILITWEHKMPALYYYSILLQNLVYIGIVHNIILGGKMPIE